jgi:hypothetical protein
MKLSRKNRRFLAPLAVIVITFIGVILTTQAETPTSNTLFNMIAYAYFLISFIFITKLLSGYESIHKSAVLWAKTFVVIMIMTVLSAWLFILLTFELHW